MLPIPSFDLQVADLAILFSAMVSFLALIWASKKLLEFMGISDLGSYIQAKKEIQKEEYRKKVREEKSNIREKQRIISERKERKQNIKDRQEKTKKLAKEKVRLEKAHIQREAFKNAKRAKDLREDELIKTSRREELHAKINDRRMDIHRNTKNDWGTYKMEVRESDLKIMAELKSNRYK